MHAMRVLVRNRTLTVWRIPVIRGLVEAEFALVRRPEAVPFDQPGRVSPLLGGLHRGQGSQTTLNRPDI